MDVGSVDVVEQLDLIQALVEVVLVVLDDLEAHEAAGLDVQGLHRLAESSRPQKVHNLPRSTTPFEGQAL